MPGFPAHRRGDKVQDMRGLTLFASWLKAEPTGKQCQVHLQSQAIITNMSLPCTHHSFNPHKAQGD